MDHIVIVRVAERRADVLDDWPGVAKGHAAANFLIEQPLERFALEVLHQYVEPLAVHVHRMHVDNVRMAELACLANLLPASWEALARAVLHRHRERVADRLRSRGASPRSTWVRGGYLLQSSGLPCA